MSTWKVAGAGDTSYDGFYYDTGVEDGERYYKMAGVARYLYHYTYPLPTDWDWRLGSVLAGTGAYKGAYQEVLPANAWTVVAGAAPAPTLSEASPSSETEVVPDTKLVAQSYPLRRQPPVPFPAEQPANALLRDLYEQAGVLLVVRGQTADSGIGVSAGWTDIPDMAYEADFGRSIVECRFVGTFESPDQTGLEFAVRLVLDDSETLGDRPSLRQETTVNTLNQGYNMSYLEVFAIPEGQHRLKMQYRNWSGGTLKASKTHKVFVVRRY